ncbi:MAG: hypothetical protein O3C40_15195 [Planctomycetota bacterium]|nr:hypothetical protein [Planctomycetota bacterium]
MANERLGFWVDGAEIHAEALEQERHERIAELKHRQELATSPAERDQLTDEMKQVRKSYEKKIAELPWLLF